MMIARVDVISNLPRQPEPQITVSRRGIYRKSEHPGTLAVNVARPSRWGNDVKISPTCTAEQAVAAYRERMQREPQLLRSLALHIDKRKHKEDLPDDAPVILLCQGNHSPCHADLLAEALKTSLLILALHPERYLSYATPWAEEIEE